MDPDPDTRSRSSSLWDSRPRKGLPLVQRGSRKSRLPSRLQYLEYFEYSLHRSIEIPRVRDSLRRYRRCTHRRPDLDEMGSLQAPQLLVALHRLSQGGKGLIDRKCGTQGTGSLLSMRNHARATLGAIETAVSPSSNTSDTSIQRDRDVRPDAHVGAPLAPSTYWQAPHQEQSPSRAYGRVGARDCIRPLCLPELRTTKKMRPRSYSTRGYLDTFDTRPIAVMHMGPFQHQVDSSVP